ncbi:hypothetical protein M8C21_004657 [Ambrosia artemisiifolia]|uniref:Uncharacterized protein n=1 Tax=Ambrosia artemisiifolia TaxID=4212 RepID=A0AAD5D9D7_AMBAR|nr:hypothetical protein M8C21_004657 [Ambrosia artemisiifolia]
MVQQQSAAPEAYAAYAKEIERLSAKESLLLARIKMDGFAIIITLVTSFDDLDIGGEGSCCGLLNRKEFNRVQRWWCLVEDYVVADGRLRRRLVVVVTGGDDRWIIVAGCGTIGPYKARFPPILPSKLLLYFSRSMEEDQRCTY